MGLSLRHRIVRRWIRLTLPWRYAWENTHTCWCGGGLRGYAVDRGLGECVECGTGVLRRRLTQAASMRFYESGDYRRSVTGTSLVNQEQFERGRRRGCAIADYLTSHGVPIAGMTVVELGSGLGGILATMLERGVASVYGIDNDRNCHIHAWRNYIPTYHPSDSVPDFPKKIDLVILSHLLEHVYHPDAVLGYKYASYFYAETPVWTIKTKTQVGHLFYFTSDSFRTLVMKAGLTIVAMDQSIKGILKRSP